MTVESFDPEALNQVLSEAVLAELVELAGSLDAEKPGQLMVPAQAAQRLAFTATHAGWEEKAAAFSAAELVSLARFYTVAEQQLSGWQAGPKSPVIPLVRELKDRKQFDPELRKWIKANTDNKFLPHGSLSDLL